jgi:dienelactone hydrolase
MTLETQQMAYCDEDARLNGFLAVDTARRDKRPGILVVHGGAGLDDHARGRARRFAEAGFVVFACDMYGEGITGREAIVRHVMELRNNRDLLRRRAQPAIEILSRHPQVDGRIAAVGYCFGGMTVLELARRARRWRVRSASTVASRRRAPRSRQQSGERFWSVTAPSIPTYR